MVHHISHMLADLYAAIDEGRPWSLVRLGDGELQALRGLQTPWSYVDENYCPTKQAAGDLRQYSKMAVTEADWVGWHRDRELGDVMESARLLPKGWTVWQTGILEQHGRLPNDTEMRDTFGEIPDLILRTQFAWVNFHMGMRRGFVERVLRDTPLFLVGKPMQRWYTEILEPAGLAENATIWQGDTTITSMDDIMRIADAFDSTEAKVMLASLGVWSLPLAWRARAIGRIAIDWGHVPDHNLVWVCPVHADAAAQRIACDEVPLVSECKLDPECRAHGRYVLNTCCEDSVEGTRRHYRHAGTASQFLPE